MTFYSRLRPTLACILNLVILGAVIAAMVLGTRFHQINMNRTY